MIDYGYWSQKKLPATWLKHKLDIIANTELVRFEKRRQKPEKWGMEYKFKCTYCKALITIETGADMSEDTEIDCQVCGHIAHPTD